MLFIDNELIVIEEDNEDNEVINCLGCSLDDGFSKMHHLCAKCSEKKSL